MKSLILSLSLDHVDVTRKRLQRGRLPESFIAYHKNFFLKNTKFFARQMKKRSEGSVCFKLLILYRHWGCSAVKQVLRIGNALYKVDYQKKTCWFHGRGADKVSVLLNLLSFKFFDKQKGFQRFYTILQQFPWAKVGGNLRSLVLRNSETGLFVFLGKGYSTFVKITSHLNNFHFSQTIL
jgi:hypothetical protein